jgi:hypothetical protein
MPKGKDGLHEPKWDGFRFQIIKDGDNVRFYSRHGAEYGDRLARMPEAFANLPGVLERLQGPGLSPGMARELKKHVASLEAEIAELEGK